MRIKAVDNRTIPKYFEEPRSSSINSKGYIL